MTIHAFEPRRLPPSRTKRPPAAGTATIIIFPGIRYERRDEDHNQAKLAPRREKADATKLV